MIQPTTSTRVALVRPLVAKTSWERPTYKLGRPSAVEMCLGGACRPGRRQELPAGSFHRPSKPVNGA